MRYLLVLLVLLIPASVLADHRSPVYLLNNTDMNTLTTGFQYALARSPDHQAIDWQNPATGLNGSTIPVRSYRTPYGQYCRDYMSTVQLGGAIQQAFGTACLQNNGRWQIAAEKPVKRTQPQIEFVYLRNKASAGCSSNGHPSVGTQKSQRNYHSDEFYEKIRGLKKAHPELKPNEKRSRQPSKLLKLVAY